MGRNASDEHLLAQAAEAGADRAVSAAVTGTERAIHNDSCVGLPLYGLWIRYLFDERNKSQ